MSSRTLISNLAISHLGIGVEIANVDTEKSEEAAACRRFFDLATEASLGDLTWTFTTKFATLNLLEETPEDEWAYKYRYPSDCITLRRILSGVRNDTSRSRIPFKLSRDGGGQVILTDQYQAKIEYTERVLDAQYFSAEFSLALSFRLAAYIAPRVTGGDPFKLKDEMLKQYLLELGAAKTNNMNEETQEQRPESEFITTRS